MVISTAPPTPDTYLPTELINRILDLAATSLKVEARMHYRYAAGYAATVHGFLRNASLVARRWRWIAQRLLLIHFALVCKETWVGYTSLLDDRSWKGQVRKLHLIAEEGASDIAFEITQRYRTSKMLVLVGWHPSLLQALVAIRPAEIRLYGAGSPIRLPVHPPRPKDRLIVAVTDLDDSDLARSAFRACLCCAGYHDYHLALTNLPSTAAALQVRMKRPPRISSISISVEAYEPALPIPSSSGPNFDSSNLAAIFPRATSLQIQLELLVNSRGTLPCRLKTLAILPSPSFIDFSDSRFHLHFREGGNRGEQAILRILDQCPLLAHLTLPSEMVSRTVYERCKQRGIKLWEVGRTEERRSV